MSEHLITPEEMAARFDGVEVSTIMEWNRKHDWPHVKVGKQIRWTPEQYDEIVRRHTPPSAKKTPALRGQTARSAARQRAAS